MIRRLTKLLFVLLIVGCSSSITSVLTDIFISPKVYSNYYNCKQYINRYNDLQDEKKQLDIEFEEQKNQNSLSDEEKTEYENRILDLSFQVSNALQDWQNCAKRDAIQP